MLRHPVDLIRRATAISGRYCPLPFIFPFVLILLLYSCASVPAGQESKAAVGKGQADGGYQAGPGDVKSINGVEYIYGKNRRWMSEPGEPEYIWVRKDQYAPRPFDVLMDAVLKRDGDGKEIEELEKRIAALEAEINRLQTESRGGPLR